MASPLGTILNKHSKLARTTHIIKAGITLNPGLCYIDGSNGLKNAPTDSSVQADELYWFDQPSVTVAAGAASKKVTVYALDGLQVIGQADGAIVVGKEVEPSTTSAHGGQLITHTIRTDSVANNNTDRKLWVGNYRGHEAEIKEGVSPLTDAVDGETNCVFDLRAGA